MLMLIAALALTPAQDQIALVQNATPPAATPVAPAVPAASADQLPAPATRATPLGDQSQWVTFDDYPPIALQEHREGMVQVMLRVNRLGFVESCTVRQSSGSPDLDQTTCTALQVRAFFDPAKDAAGQPISSDVPKRIRWTIPPETPPTSIPPAVPN